jgi:hypothetical protein
MNEANVDREPHTGAAFKLSLASFIVTFLAIVTAPVSLHLAAGTGSDWSVLAAVLGAFVCHGLVVIIAGLISLVSGFRALRYRKVVLWWLIPLILVLVVVVILIASVIIELV